jgi:Flp pilus assembly secretin CpaC
MNNFHIAAILFAALFFPVYAASSALADAEPPAIPQDSTIEAETGDLETTHPMIRLTPDKSELINLDRAAISVVVGNPAHLSVLLDTPKMLVLVPRVPGATYFTALDEAGNVIMQRHVIVASPKKNYVRIRRSCANGAEGCRATSVYFCPDICHEIDTPQMGSEVEGSTIPSQTPSGAAPSLEQPESEEQPATGE